MTRADLYAGPALRKLRRHADLTQAAMAARLGISSSYLTLLERNQRPLSARVLMQLVSEFEVDPLSLRPDDSTGGIDGMTRRLTDARFADLAIDRGEVEELLATAPSVAAAFARLYDGHSPAAGVPDDPGAIARQAIEQWRNHFADLDHSAEQLADELRLSRGDSASALIEHLRQRHQLSVRIVPESVIPGMMRRLDLHARQVQLSEMLAPAARTFQLAKQLAILEQRSAVEAIAAGSGIAPGSAARILFERHLYSYFAAALVMPYSRFVRACQATGYNLPILQGRFGVSFEQLAHRLTTLQRVGERGLPIFMVRVDAAGQFSKLLAGASGATFLDVRGSCPLWRLHSALGRPDEWHIQQVEVDSASPADWITIARSSGDSDRGRRFAIAIGLETRLAGELAMLRRMPPPDKTLTGMGCVRCRRVGCHQRSLPPAGLKLAPDRMIQGATPFSAAPSG